MFRIAIKALCAASIALPSAFSAVGCAGPTHTSDVRFDVATLESTASADDLPRTAIFAERTATFQITRGQHAGDRLTLSVTRDGSTGTITRTLGDGTKLSEQRFEITNDGTVIERAFQNHERDVIVELEPDLRLWPVKGRTQKLDFRLPKLSDPDSIKERGTATNTATIESLDTVTTPAGTFEAIRVRIVFESDLTAADAKRITERWYTRDHGLIAERWDETVKAFGIPIEQSSRTIVRTP